MTNAFIRKLASTCLPPCAAAHGNAGTVHYLVRRQVVDGAVGFSVKTIRIIVAASPGTADDFFARSVAAELKSRYKPRVFVDNRPSAGGLIGNSLASKAAADGHTLGMVSVKRLVTELLHDATPYRAVADIVRRCARRIHHQCSGRNTRDTGLPEAQIDSWSGIVAPKGTPRRIVEQLHGDIVRGLRKAPLRQLFQSLGAESTPESTPDGFMRMMQEEYARYQTLIRVGGIKVE